MPCYATGSAEGDARLEAKESSELVTKLTRILCDTWDAYKDYRNTAGESFSPPVSFTTWGEKHDKIDAARIAQEEKDKKERLDRITIELAKLEKEFNELKES